MKSETWVFAYGSNMDPDDYRSWCERAGRSPGQLFAKAQVAILRDHSLCFDYFADAREGGAANVRAEQGASVYGLALCVDSYDFASLDLKEGHPTHYVRFLCQLEFLSGQSVDGWVYQVHSDQRRPTYVPPTSYYLGLIQAAALRHQFPSWYQDFLAGLEFISAPPLPTIRQA